MMDDLIRRETARRIIASPRSKEQMLTVLKNTPAVQPERKTGRWISYEQLDFNILECSVCGYQVGLFDDCIYNFCSACGAKMLKEGDA